MGNPWYMEYYGNSASNLMHLTPSEIKERLDENIYSQEEAKKAAALLLYSHIRDRRRNMLFVGPSGCGKTEIFREMKKIFPLVQFFDAGSVTTEGFSGAKKYYTPFADMLREGYSEEEAEHAIIVIDEADKLFAPLHDSAGDNVNDQIQSEYLAMVEGTKVSIPKIRYVIDSSNVSLEYPSRTSKRDRHDSHCSAEWSN